MLLLGGTVKELIHEIRNDNAPGSWNAGQVFEETLELDAYMVLLFGACVFGRIYRGAVRASAQRGQIT